MHKLVRVFGTSSLLGVALVALSACGGGGNNGNPAIIGGKVTGLNIDNQNQVEVTNNTTDKLTLSANESFVFANKVKAGSQFSVNVSKQPFAQTCSVKNGAGKVANDGSDVTGIIVNCVNNTSVIAKITGLTEGKAVTLKLSGSDATSALESYTKMGNYPLGSAVAKGTTLTLEAVSPDTQTCLFAASQAKTYSTTVTDDKWLNITVLCTNNK